MLFVRHTCHLHDRGTVVPERDRNQGQRTTQNEVIELDINRGIEREGVSFGVIKLRAQAQNSLCLSAFSSSLVIKIDSAMSHCS